MRFFLLLLLAISVAFPACSGDVIYRIPAVVGESGGLVLVEMLLAPGPGNTYVTITPRIGTSTQESIENAVTYAREIADFKESCDVYVNFPNKAGDLIDGPSGGAAFAVMAYSLFEEKELRRDTIITGTVDKYGNVGAVGGLYEKAKGAASINSKYFITPEEDLYETFLLKDIKDELNLTILQTKNMEEIIGFMFYNETIEEVGLSSKKRPIPTLPYYNYSGINNFKKVADRMIDLEQNLISNITTNDNDTAIVKSFYENEVVRQKAILEKGYLFTAANEAFLNYIDIWTIYATINGSVDLQEKIDDINQCLSDIKRPDMTDVNFEWVIGADLRQNWARNRVENTDTDNLLEEEKYAAYNDLMYSQAWCEVAKGLLNSTDESGNRIDESAWKEIAKRKLEEAEGIEMLDSDLEDRLAIAKQSFQDAEYGAATYDAVFVIVQSEDFPDEANFSIFNESRQSLWGQVYQAHAMFFYTQNQTTLAYTTARLAEELDSITTEMKDDIRIEQNGGIFDQQQADYTIVALGLIFLFIVVLIISRRRSDGINGPGHRKTNRTR